MKFSMFRPKENYTMRSNLSKITFTVTIAALLFLMSCDSSSESALVGSWVGVSSVDKDKVLELLSDGTGAFNGVAIKWKVERGRFFMTAFGRMQQGNYELQGSLFTFFEDNGNVSEWIKCQKDCKEAAKEYSKAKLTELDKIKKGSSSFIDSRDGKSYLTVKLDNQTWMAENLNYEAEGSKCYDNNPENCQKYGRLYSWETAKKTCPAGWHLPSDVEWQILVDLVGGDKTAGNVLKASGGWNNNSNNEDAVGFSALPGGYGGSNGNFSSVGDFGYWWSATEYDASSAYRRGMYYYASVNRLNRDNGFLYSVRCVQD